jgi:hypothetical protein
MMRPRVGASLFGATLAVSLLVALLVPGRAAAIEHNFAGSAQLDYHFVPTEPNANANAGTLGTFDGFTVETALKLAVDISDHLSANVKACYGCHGLELDMAYFDLRAVDELNVRVGRFSPSFGAFNLRHDPANHKLSDKPLPYDMGRMLRKGDWNNGVLPSPFPDNGVELDGTHWLGDAVQLDYAAYAVMGFRSNLPNPVDFDFQESHTPYYVDNNGRPTGGARLALTVKTGDSSDVTLGASGMFGTYDPNNRLTYAIAGADLSIRIHRTSLRLEYLLRRQQFDTSNPASFKYALAPADGDFFTKHGAYAEIEQPLSRTVDLIARVDGMYRVGNVLATSALSRQSSVVRETIGAAYAIERNFRIKLSTELWQFSDADADGRQVELSFHLGAVGSF